MSDFEDKRLDFVLKHYKEGKFDTQKAIDRFNEAHGIQRKPRRRVLPWVSGIVAAAAAVALGVNAICSGLALMHLAMTPRACSNALRDSRPAVWTLFGFAKARIMAQSSGGQEAAQSA